LNTNNNNIDSISLNVCRGKLLSGGEDGVIKIWNSDLECEAEVQHKQEVNVALFYKHYLFGFSSQYFCVWVDRELQDNIWKRISTLLLGAKKNDPQTCYLAALPRELVRLIGEFVIKLEYEV
jgi:hypothetical protein